MSPQDKILYVANKLGLSTLKDMQGSTGAVYDADIENTGVIFGNASKHDLPGVTNLNDNQFEVNEALLVETIGFYASFGNIQTGTYDSATNIQRRGKSSFVIVFDLMVANKVVMKQVPMFFAGQPNTFASIGTQVQNVQPFPEQIGYYTPRHQIYLEGAGILIPPQVKFSVEYKLYDINSDPDAAPAELTQAKVGCYLFGTSVLTNFNTSI